MRVVPPPIPQPQGIPQITPPKPLESTIIEKEVLHSEQNPTEITRLESNNIQQEEKIIIRDKRAYRAFIRLVKQGKYTSATIAARLTGVSRQTIARWLESKKVQEAMQSEVNQYVSDIKASKQWQAKAYLLDKLEDKDNIKDSTVNLTNLIQINTVSPSQE